MTGVRFGKLELTWTELAPRTLTYGQFYALHLILDDELSDDDGVRVIVDRDDVTRQVGVAVVPRVKGGGDSLAATVRAIVEEFIASLD